MDTSTGIDDCLRGNLQSRLYFESLLTKDEFWNVLIQVLEKDVVTQENNSHSRILFILAMISRRLKVYGNPDRDVIEGIINSVVKIVFNDALRANHTIARNAAGCLGLFLCKTPPEDFSNVLAYLYNLLRFNDVFLLTFLGETADAAIAADNAIRSQLRGTLEEVLKICSGVLQTSPIGSGDRSQPIAVLHCIRSWITSGLMLPSHLLYKNSESNPTLFDSITNTIYDNDIEIINSIVEILETIHKNQQENRFGDQEGFMRPEDKILLFQSINSVLISNMANFERIYSDYNQILLCLASVHLLMITIRLFLPLITSGKEPSPLITLLLISSQHPSLKIANLAYELWPEVYRSISKERRKTLPQFSAIFRPLSQSILQHMRRPVNLDDTCDEGSINEDEWMAMREQALSGALVLCYYEMRSELLQDITDSIDECLTGYFNSQSNHTALVTAVNDLEALLYSIRSIIFESSKRALLASANSVSIFNASKVSNSHESHDEVSKDAKVSATILYRLLTGLLSVPSQAPTSAAHPLTHPIIIRNTARIIGSLGSWLNKCRPSDLASSEDVYQASSSVKQLTERSLVYLLQALTVPAALYHAASALRTLCQHCGRSLASAMSLNMVLSTWTELCNIDISFLNNDDCSDLQGMVVEEGTDILIESKKSVMQAICLILRHVSPYDGLPYVTQLVQPTLSKLQKEFEAMLTTQNISSSSFAFQPDVSNQYSVTLCGTVDIIAMFIRSINIPMPTDEERNLLISKDQEYMKKRFSSHPAVILMGGCGNIFIDILKSYPHKQIAESVTHLMTSLITFLGPHSPIDALPDFLDFTWERHVKGVISVHSTPVADFIIECVQIFGHYGEGIARLSTDQMQIPNESLSSYKVHSFLQDMFSEFYSCFLRSQTTSDEGVEFQEQLLSVFTNGLKYTPVILFQLPFLRDVITLAVTSISRADQPALGRASSLFFIEMFNLRDFVTQESVPSSFDSYDSPPWWSFVLSQLESIEDAHRNKLLIDCITQLLGSCAEIVTDNMGSLLFALLNRGFLQVNDYQGFKRSILNIVPTTSQSRISEPVIELVFAICLNVKGHSQSTQEPNISLSEFLDLCGMIWKFGCGQTNLETIQQHACIKKLRG